MATTASRVSRTTARVSRTTAATAAATAAATVKRAPRKTLFVVDTLVVLTQRAAHALAQGQTVCYPDVLSHVVWVSAPTQEDAETLARQRAASRMDDPAHAVVRVVASRAATHDEALAHGFVTL